jgi:hypothetical protein
VEVPGIGGLENAIRRTNKEWVYTPKCLSLEAPILFVKKKNGTLRWCIDSR